MSLRTGKQSKKLDQGKDFKCKQVQREKREEVLPLSQATIGQERDTGFTKVKDRPTMQYIVINHAAIVDDVEEGMETSDWK